MSNVRAILLILGAMMCFAVQDVVVKLTASEVSLWQMQAVRSAAVLVMLVGVVAAIGRGPELIPRNWRWPLARAIFMVGAYLFFYAALPHLTLAKAASAFFIGPLLITLFAAIFLGEPIGPRRIASVVVGFVGVLFIVQPGLDGWTPIAALPVLAAVCYAMGVVITRWRCREDPGFSLTLVHNLLYAAVGVLGVVIMPLVPLEPGMRTEHAFLVEGWLPLSLGVAALLVVTAATHIGGILMSVRAYQEAEASTLAPYEYVYLVIVPVFDYVFWGQLPVPATLIGMALICGSGGFVAWREGRPARPRIQQNAELPWTPDDGDGKTRP